MSKNVAVVIGAQYGDEGKGLVTDYLSRPDALVVRFNGGAQAGHTVVTPEGTRHVFHHFGSGTLAGAATFLSSFFIVNPIFYGRELKELRGKGVEPKVIIDPDCIVTTPYDMLLNEAAERMRGVHRHGSCGFGINETVVRNESPAFGLTYCQLKSAGFLEKRLKDIREAYVPDRAHRLGITEPIPHLFSVELVLNYMRDVAAMLDHATIESWTPSLHAGWNRLVFEGAQGLRLDMNSPDFPHVTRSNTGLTNVLPMLAAGNLLDRSDPAKVYYLTRTYVTRHGAGPLKRELSAPPYKDIVDDTNIPNPHQGTLRFAHLDLDDLFTFIEKDLSQVQHAYVSPRIVLTCADQLKDSEFVLYSKDERIVGPAQKGFELLLPKILQPKDRMFTTSAGFFSIGRTRNDVLHLWS